MIYRVSESAPQMLPRLNVIPTTAEEPPEIDPELGSAFVQSFPAIDQFKSAFPLLRISKLIVSLL